MKAFSYLLFLFLLNHLYGCRSVQNEDVKTELYKNGVVKREFQITKDTIKHGYYREYFPNGNLKIVATFFNSKLDSTYLTFYSNGAFAEKLNYSEGFLFGEQRFYFPNGLLSQYSVVDGFEDVIYVKRWDNKGNIIKDEGVAISPNVYCDKCENSTVRKGEVVTFEGMVSHPPNTNAKVVLGDIISNHATNRTPLKIQDNNVIRFQKEFTEIGQYLFFIVCEISDTNGIVILSDSVSKKLKVE